MQIVSFFSYYYLHDSLCICIHDFDCILDDPAAIRSKGVGGITVVDNKVTAARALQVSLNVIYEIASFFLCVL